jgi:hypothetical protein
MQQLGSIAGPTALARTEIESRRQREDAWPGDRIPVPSDAEMAYRILDPRQGLIFKQAMLADSQARGQRQMLSPENAQVLLQQAACTDSVSHT